MTHEPTRMICCGDPSHDAERLTRHARRITDARSDRLRGSLMGTSRGLFVRLKVHRLCEDAATARREALRRWPT